VNNNRGVECHNFKMPVNYEWLKFVATDSAIKAKDILDIFDICIQTLQSRISEGNFPKPDYVYENRKGFSTRLPSNPRYWKKETVANEIRRLQKELHESTLAKELRHDDNLTDLGHGKGYALTQDKLRLFK